MKNRKRLTRYVLCSVVAICIAISVAGCATLKPGPQFTQLDPIPAGKSVVYFLSINREFNLSRFSKF